MPGTLGGIEERLRQDSDSDAYLEIDGRRSVMQVVGKRSQTTECSQQSDAEGEHRICPDHQRMHRSLLCNTTQNPCCDLYAAEIRSSSQLVFFSRALLLLSRHAQSCAPEQLGFHVFSSLVLNTKCFFFSPFFSFVGSALQGPKQILETLCCTQKWAKVWYPYILGSCGVYYRNILSIAHSQSLVSI